MYNAVKQRVTDSNIQYVPMYVTLSLLPTRQGIFPPNWKFPRPRIRSELTGPNGTDRDGRNGRLYCTIWQTWCRWDNV